MNAEFRQVALQDGANYVAVLARDADSGELRFQQRESLSGLPCRREFVSLGGYEIYAVEGESQGQRQVKIFHYLPNGTIREELSKTSSAI